MKEICTLMISTLLVHDKVLTAVNVAGMGLSVAGVALYNIIKLRRHKQAEYSLSLEQEERAVRMIMTATTQHTIPCRCDISYE
jgi:hypothetical protein